MFPGKLVKKNKLKKRWYRRKTFFTISFFILERGNMKEKLSELKKQLFELRQEEVKLKMAQDIESLEKKREEIKTIRKYISLVMMEELESENKKGRKK